MWNTPSRIKLFSVIGGDGFSNKMGSGSSGFSNRLSSSTKEDTHSRADANMRLKAEHCVPQIIKGNV